MKFGLAQINTTVGDFDQNLKSILRNLSEAGKRGADLVVFPELALTGYPPKDLLDRPDFVRENLKFLKKLTKQVTHPACLVGFVDQRSEKRGKALANAAALIHQGKILAVVHKQLLPTYDVFDEKRYFEPGKDSVVVDFLGTRLAISICEDLWMDAKYWGREPYPVDPVERAAKAGAQCLVNLSASPYAMGKWRTRRDILTRQSRRFKMPLIYVNAVGGNDELVFDGASCALDAKSRWVLQMPSFREALEVLDVKKARPLKVSHYDEDEHALDALMLGLRDYLRKCGFDKVVLGLSGGIDSALTAWIAARALGADRVLGVALPSPYSSAGSLKDAESLAKKLGIEYRVIPIETPYRAMLQSLGYEASPKKITLTLQNLQARIRGNLLMALSNEEGRMLLSTGNKSELAMGYCTLYGDMAGGFSLLADVPKALVYRLARLANRRFPAIPRATLTKPPSAELAPNQKDEDELPPYEVLDPILAGYVEKGLLPEKLPARDYPKSLVQKILRRLDANEYKRRQAAPGIRVTDKAFGYGRRVPIAHRYRVKI